MTPARSRLRPLPRARSASDTRSARRHQHENRRPLDPKHADRGRSDLRRSPSRRRGDRIRHGDVAGRDGQGPGQAGEPRVTWSSRTPTRKLVRAPDSWRRGVHRCLRRCGSRVQGHAAGAQADLADLRLACPIRVRLQLALIRETGRFPNRGRPVRCGPAKRQGTPQGPTRERNSRRDGHI